MDDKHEPLKDLLHKDFLILSAAMNKDHFFKTVSQTSLEDIEKMKDQILKWIKENKAECIGKVYDKNNELQDWFGNDIIRVDDFIKFLESFN